MYVLITTVQDMLTIINGQSAISNDQLIFRLRLRGALIFNGCLIAVSALVTGLLVNHYKLYALQFVADENSRP